MPKKKTKIYIRTFKFDDGTEESVEGKSEDFMGPRYRSTWAREKFNKKKIVESKDSIRWE